MIPENCSKFHLKKTPFNVISKLEAFISQRKSGFAVIATYKILENRSEWSSQSPIRASVVPHRASLIKGSLKDQQLQGLGTCIPAISQYIPAFLLLPRSPLVPWTSWVSLLHQPCPFQPCYHLGQFIRSDVWNVRLCSLWPGVSPAHQSPLPLFSSAWSFAALAYALTNCTFRTEESIKENYWGQKNVTLEGEAILYLEQS